MDVEIVAPPTHVDIADHYISFLKTDKYSI